MVKLLGPALSLSASGTVGEAVTISNWKGRHYMKRHSIPKDPRTQAQVPHRLMTDFLSKAWLNLTDAQRETWSDVARPQKVPPYNAYMGYNLQRFTCEKGPSKHYPATETGSLPTLGKFQPTVSSGIHCVHSDLVFTPAQDTWGYLLLARRISGDPPDLTPLVHVAIAKPSPTHNLVTLQLALGLWQITARLFTNAGLIGPMRNQQSGTSLDY